MKHVKISLKGKKNKNYSKIFANVEEKGFLKRANR